MKAFFGFCTTGLMAGSLAFASMASAGATGVDYFDQGPDWTADARNDYYSQDQGARIMPLSWMFALKQANGQPFMADSLSRYGYLPNPASRPAGLPVGFSINKGKEGDAIGLTCAACHTRQIEVEGQAYRADGGPAIVDAQSFFADMDKAVAILLEDKSRFDEFAETVLGSKHSARKHNRLKADVQAWHLPYHTLMSRALPKEPWGVARLDAVSMIFNRLAGLDIGTAPNHMIPGNIAVADVPVRYPFIWNAVSQDKTQWPGFADNGTKVLGLSRNLGEVYGVFAQFHPVRSTSRRGGIDYLKNNSANFDGLNDLEDLIRRMGPPKWLWPVDQTLASRGKVLYDEYCGPSCHEKKVNPRGLRAHDTWHTPVQDVGTDSREYAILTRQVDTGVLAGAEVSFGDAPLKPRDSAVAVLKTAVTGAILQRYLPLRVLANVKGKIAAAVAKTNPETEDLKGAFNAPAQEEKPFRYESRVMEGIWAAAPYLHNGSVPSLEELLKPAAKRVSAFKLGPAYDIRKVGLATQQTRFDSVYVTTDCSDRNSGNSRCGHEFGTNLPEADKKALLEYLKIL